MPSVLFGNTDQPATDSLKSWVALLASSLATLRQLAGSTEHDFLQIGSRMQEDAEFVSRPRESGRQ